MKSSDDIQAKFIKINTNFKTNNINAFESLLIWNILKLKATLERKSEKLNIKVIIEYYI